MTNKKEQKYFKHTTAWDEDVYRVVDSIEDVPYAFKIWNIGRENFPFEGYIPMARIEGYAVDTTTLIAVPMPSEEVALKLMKQSMNGKNINGRYLHKHIK